MTGNLLTLHKMPVVLPLHGKVLRLRSLGHAWDSRGQPARGLGVHAGKMQSTSEERYGGDRRCSWKRRRLVLKTQEKFKVGPCLGPRVPRRVLANLGLEDPVSVGLQLVLTPHLYSRPHGLSSRPTCLYHYLSVATGHTIQGLVSGASLVPIHTPARCCWLTIAAHTFREHRDLMLLNPTAFAVPRPILDFAGFFQAACLSCLARLLSTPPPITVSASLCTEVSILAEQGPS